MSIATLVLMALVLTLAAAAAIVIFVVRGLRRNALAAGYPGVGAYLRAVPRNDEEKRQAVDLALKGAGALPPKLALERLVIGLV